VRVINDDGSERYLSFANPENGSPVYQLANIDDQYRSSPAKFWIAFVLRYGNSQSVGFR